MRFRSLNIIAIFLGLLLLMPQNAYACTSPVGVEGEIIFGDDDNVPAYCDGTNWIGMVGAEPVTSSPTGCPNIGDLCSDGSIFAGDTNLYVTDENQSDSIQWKASTGNDDINPDSNSDGAANHANITVPITDLPAINLCETLDRHGHQDWYLPAIDELDQLCQNEASINASAAEPFGTGAPSYFSSTEFSDIVATNLFFSSCNPVNTTFGASKAFSRRVRCVRREINPGQTQLVPSGLVGHWRLDETSGSTIVDSSSTGNDGSWNDTDNNNVQEESVVGVLGRALQSNGLGGNSVSIPNNPIYNAGTTGSFSISGWFRNTFTAVGDDLNIFKEGGGTTFMQFAVEDGRILSRMRASTGGFVTFTGGNSGEFSDGKWHHAVVTVDRDNTITTIYVNGVQRNSANNSAHTGLLGPDTTSSMLIQGNDSLDDVRYYNRALTPEEVFELYNARDGIRYNENHRTPEYFDGNRFVSLRPDFSEPGKTPIFGYPDIGCPNIGDVCSDGSVYAGISPDGNVPMYVASAANAITTSWNNGGALAGAVGVTNMDDGDGNTAALLVTVDGHEPYLAAQHCDGLEAHGSVDWYLPAPNEAVLFYDGGTPIGDLIATNYWTSASASFQDAHRITNLGTIGVLSKNFTGATVRCVRKADFGVVDTGGLIAHWKLDDTNGTTATDSSGNGNDGTMNDIDFPDQSIRGAIGTAIKFTLPPTTSDVERITSSSGFPTGINQPFTISMWTNIINYWDGAFFFVGSTAGNQEVYMRTDANGNQLRFYYGASNITDSNYFSGYFDNWVFMTIVFDGTDLIFYRDGVEVNRQATGTFTITQSAFGIGHAYTGGSTSQVQGSIDDFRLYDRALSVSEIQQLYTMGTPVGSSTTLPQGCPDIGDVCDDGSIYVGLSPDGNEEMFVITEDVTGLSWNGGNNSEPSMTDTSVTDNITGEANTNAIILIDSDSVTAGFQTHDSAQYCYDLIAHGASDWYLPARNELSLIYTNLSSIYDFSNQQYQSSSQSSATSYRNVDFTDGNTGGTLKDRQRRFRCVRKGPAPRCANPYGLEGQMIYNSTHDVVQYCDGARWIGIGK